MRIIRLRPGPLANFSGGAGHMPMLVIFTVPASCIFFLVSSFVLYANGKRFLKETDGERVDLPAFIRYAKSHAIFCLITAGLFCWFYFSQGDSSLYGDPTKYLGLRLAVTCAPFVSWIFSTYVLMKLMMKRGARITNLLITAVLHVSLTLLVIVAVGFIYVTAGML